MHRRKFLASVGASFTILSTGCVEEVEDALDNSVQLGWFGGVNFDSEAHQFELRVKRDGTQVHYSSHSVPGKEGVYVHSGVADCTWGDVAGEYRVAARVDGEAWLEESATKTDTMNGQEFDCVTAEARYHRDSLNILHRGGCDQGYDGMCPFVN